MRRIRFIFLLLLVVLVCNTAGAQGAKYRSLNDSTVVKYLLGGYVRDGKLHLMVNEAYWALGIDGRKEILNTIADGFPDIDITVYGNRQQREGWHSSAAGVFLVEQWNNDDLQLENYKPLELKRSGNDKVFYYVGGAFSKNDSYSNGAFNLRAGTYLYKNTVDISTTFSMGYAQSLDSTNFTGDIGVDSRYYLPFRLEAISLTPYVGMGIAWVYAPESHFELRLLAGACWFLGPGSLDLGLQYGTQSKWALTIGYTFRPFRK